MTTFTHTCEHCGTRFEYPENIVELIRKYLIKKGYIENPFQSLNCCVYEKDDDTQCRIYIDVNLESKEDVSETIPGVIRSIAFNENRTPQDVLSDILYDHARYLRGQLATFKGFLAETTEGDWINRTQIEAKIERLEQSLASELAKESRNE